MREPPRQLVPGDVILLRGMCGFWPQITLEENGLAGGMHGEALGGRMPRGHITLLVIGTIRTIRDDVGETSAIMVLAPNVGPCWTWDHGLFSSGLGDGELL